MVLGLLADRLALTRRVCMEEHNVASAVCAHAVAALLQCVFAPVLRCRVPLGVGANLSPTVHTPSPLEIAQSVKRVARRGAALGVLTRCGHDALVAVSIGVRACVWTRPFPVRRQPHHETAQRLSSTSPIGWRPGAPSAAESVRKGLGRDPDRPHAEALAAPASVPRDDQRGGESPSAAPGSSTRRWSAWRGGQMMLRWVCGRHYLRPSKACRSLEGVCSSMPTLVNALRARERQLGLLTAQEDRQVA